MSAWIHRTVWNQGSIAQYGLKCATWYVEPNSTRLDCADFALKLVVEFAAPNGLPVVLAGGGQVFDSRSFAGSTPQFLRSVQRSVGAVHLQLPTNTRLLGHGAHLVRPGCLLLHLVGGRATHVQIATRVSRDHRWVSVVQGNVGMGVGPRTIFTGRMVQLGTLPQAASYSAGADGFAGSYIRNGRNAVTRDLWRSIEVREWNFEGWNQP